MVVRMKTYASQRLKTKLFERGHHTITRNKHTKVIFGRGDGHGWIFACGKLDNNTHVIIYAVVFLFFFPDGHVGVTKDTVRELTIIMSVKSYYIQLEVTRASYKIVFINVE